MNAVVTSTTPLGYADIERLAASIAQSGLFGIKTKDQAIALMMIAHAEGRHPALAARDYDVIQGRPAKKAEAMLRDFLEAGGKTQWHALSDEIADATFSHPSGGSVRIMWNMERASKAGLGGKDNWKKFPRQMLRSRTVSEGVRTVWPMATSGMHVPEETVDFAGTTLDAQAEPEPPPLRAAAAPMPRADRIAEKAPAYEAPPQPKQTIGQFLDSLEIAVRDCDSLAAVNRINASPKVVQARQTLRNGALERLESIIAAGLAAHAPVTYPTDDDGDAASEDLDEVQIVGADKLAAG
jgi:hypothetical protein